MKKSILAITILLLVSNLALADASTRNYKKCFLHKRYNTRAQIYHWDINSGVSFRAEQFCGYCVSQCHSEVVNAGGHATAICGPNRNYKQLLLNKGWQGGYNPYRILENYNNQPTVRNTSLMSERVLKGFSIPPPVYSGINASDSMVSIEYDSINRTITLVGYFACLNIKQDTIDNYYVNLSIQGVYNKQEDTIVENDSIFYSINVYMEGQNDVIVDGISSDNFTQTISANEVECRFVGDDLIINVPSNINFENVGISTTLDAGDIAAIGGGVPFVLSEPNKRSQYSKFQVNNIFPIPATNLLNISLSSSSNTLVSFKIIDELGKVINIEKNILLNKGENLKQIHAESIASGTYLLIINDGKKDYQIKFIKE